MGIVTDSQGNVIREVADTLEDWRQAAEVEAKLRREFQVENAALKTALGECIKKYVPAYAEERYSGLLD